MPESAIAQEAIEPRHDARLLDTRDMSDHVFLDLASMLRPGDLVVVNETRVRAARLVGQRAGTGGEVELVNEAVPFARLPKGATAALP